MLQLLPCRRLLTNWLVLTHSPFSGVVQAFVKKGRKQKIKKAAKKSNNRFTDPKANLCCECVLKMEFYPV